LKGQTAVLTGAARGLGLAFAQILGEAGANIAVLDVIQPDEALYKIGTDHNVKVSHQKVDVTNRQAVYQAIETIEKEFGAIHIKYASPIPSRALGRVTDGFLVSMQPVSLRMNHS
jgi:NAD(P)-dependent dehydrogenase (short-subunit alcohol dehydrogenase family)